ncbi:MAG: hypothetical protein OXI43_12580 [Candidatus Poribacteria bacterium]|nr:hypothetical protein [Candidatus Poribacteria bacterium]
MKQQPNNDLKAILEGGQTEAPRPEPESAVEAPKSTNKYRNPKREGKKALMTFVDKATHKKLKLLSIEKEKNMEDLFQEAVELLLEMHNM